MCDIDMDNIEFNFDLLVDKNAFVTCDTIEKAETLIRAVKTFLPEKFYKDWTVEGYLRSTWRNAENNSPKDRVAYCIDSDYMSYCRTSWFEEEGWTSIPYDKVIVVNPDITWELSPLTMIFEGSVTP